MGAQLWPVVVLLVVLAIVNTEAGSCRAAGCSKTGGNGIFKYASGHTYVYSLNGKSLVNLPEQQGEGVKLELKAVAEVHFGADCTNTLKLRDVSVTGPTAKEYGNLKELEAHAVRFSFNDGSVEPELCADDADHNTALNIKRAVISLLQVSTPQASGSAAKFETDVFGTCPTNFVVDKKGGQTHVTKTRNLNKCSHREDLRQRVLSTPYVTDSQIQSSPLLDSRLVVEQTAKAGVLQSAESHETYTYKPFSNKDAGLKTVIVTKLTLVSEGAAAPHAVTGGTARSLIFDAPHGDGVANSSPGAIVAALQKAKEAMPDLAGPTAATAFRHLVQVFRHSSKDDLLTVYGQVKAGAGFSDKVAARKVFLDALFRAGTGDSVQVAVELLNTNELTGNLARVWYSSFGFVRHATLPALSAAATLLDNPNAPKEAFLGVGSLAGQYCQEHDCKHAKPLDDLLAKLAKPLAAGCHCATHDQENKIIAALKGIENVREVNEATAELLRVCASDVSVPARVRVSALETFRVGSCQPQLKKSALEILKNTDEDSEIRIKAYLAAVTCPCGKCANTLKELLDNEPVNQVGSFIVSHLRNIRASTNPDHALAKQHLSQVRSAKRFPEDIRRYSHNREVSYFLDALNVGASVERTVIFSQQSYLPRSTALNITTELFGHSFNLIEIDTRAENLDRIVEAYFGPKGYFKTHDVEELLTNGNVAFKGIKDKLREHVQKTFRPKRSVPQDKLEAFRNKVALVNDRKNIDLDLNVKLFGSNVGGLSYHGNGKELTPEHIFDKLFDCLDNSIEKAKNFNYDVKKHAMFLESELAYPTGLGFPLKLTVSGSVAVHLKLDGKLDLHTLLEKPKDAHIQFQLVPSSAVEIVGDFSIDAYAVEAGIKLSGVLHSSTGVSVDLKTVDGSGFDVSVGLPVKKQEIVNFKSEVLTSVQERGQASVETAVGFNCKRRDYHGCFDQLSPLVGLTFCGDFGVPFDGVNSKAAFFPLNGPSRLSLSVEADDVSSYRLRGVANVQDADRKSLELLIDTPNSKNSRKLELVLEANKKPNRELRATLTSPVKSASAELVVTDNESEHSITGKLVNDGAEYLVKVGADISGDADHKTYKPLLEYSTPHSKEKTGKKGKKGKQAQPEYNVQGSMVVDKTGDSKKYSFENVVLSAPAGKVSVNGWVAHDKDSISSDLKVVHGQDDSVIVKGKAQRISKSHFKVDGEVVTTQYPDLGVNLNWEYNRGKDQLETNLVLVHGKDLTSTSSRITANALVKYRWANSKDFDYSGKANVAYPLLGVEGTVEGGAAPKSVHYKLDGTYEKSNVRSELSAKCNTNAPGDYDITFEAKVLDSSVKFDSRREVVTPTQSKFSNCLELQPGGKYELNADITCKREEGGVFSKILAEAKVAGKTDAYTLDAGIEVNPQLLESHAKVSHGAVDFVDVSGKLTKGSNPAGNFKALIKDHVDGSGQFKVVNGAGSMTLTVDLKKLDRKIKASGDLTIAGTVRSLNLDVFLNADKDPSKKIHVSSTSDVQPHAIDSKNALEVFDYKTALNFKGTLEGRLTDGHLKGSADLTLPNERYITGSIDRILHVRPENTEMLATVELSSAEKKGAPARAVTLKARGDKITIRRGIFDIEYDLVYKTPAGKDVNYHLLAKSLPEDAKHCIEFKGLVKGSLFELAPLVHVKVDLGKPLAEYKVRLNLAADSNLELNGKFQKSDGATPCIVENALEVNLPTGELKNVKVTEVWSYLRGQDGKPCQLKGSTTATLNNEQTLKVEADLQGNKQEGAGKVTVTLPKDETPHVFQGSFKVDKSAGHSRQVSATCTHGDKESHVEVKVEVPESKDSVRVTVAGRSPLEKLRTFKVIFNGARNELVVQSDTTIETNDKKVVITTKRGRDPKNPLLEVGVVHPGGKSFLGFNFHKKDSLEAEFGGELNLEHGGDALAAKLDARVPSAQDFEIKLDLDSERLKLKKIHIVVANKPAKGGKSLTVQASEEGQNIISGKLDYHFEDGSNGVLYEAKGNLKVRGENKAAKISVKRNIIETDTEHGIELVLVTFLGDRSIEADYKRTNKQILVSSKVCKDKDACGHVKYDSAFTIDLIEFHNEVTADMDLTGLGLKTDLKFHRVTERKPKLLSNVVTISSQDKQVHKSSLHVTDKEASLVINTAQREIAAEAKYALTFDPANSRHVTLKVDASAWLDRVREPAAKTSLLVNADYLRNDESVTLTHEAKFQHPALGKDLIVKGKTVVGGRGNVLDSNVEIDVFAKKGQKIVVDTKIAKNVIANGYNFTACVDVKSKGQNLDVVFDSHVAASTSVVGLGSTLTYTDKTVKKDLGFGYQATLSKLSVFVKTPSDVLVDIDVAGKLEDHYPSVHALFDVIGLKAVVADAGFEKDHKFVYQIYRRDTPERKVQGLYVLDLSSKAVAQSEWVQGATTKELFNVVLSWGKQVKPQVTYSLDNVKELLEYLRADLAACVQKMKTLSKELATEASTEFNDVLENLKKAQPNLKPLLAAYQEQLKAIRSEIASDKSIQELSDVVKAYVGTASESIAQVTEVVAKIADKVVDLFERLSTTLLTSLKKIIPTVTDSLNKIFQVSVDVSNALVNQALVNLQRLVEFVKKHEGEFKQAIAVVAEISRDFAGVIGRGVSQAWREISDFVLVLSDQLKALPMFGMIQERIQELKQQVKDFQPPEQVFETIQEIATGLKESLPTEELKDFVSALTGYIEKVLKKQKVDDVAELKVIYQKLVAAVKSVLTLVRAEVGAKEAQSLAGISQWPLHLRALWNLPTLASVHLSPLAYLRSDDLPTLKELYYTYRPTLNPLDWIPPYNAYGILIDSSHFFTFDRRHYTFKGTCSYVLAQDVVNGNFTLVLNLDNGKFKSVQLSDGTDTVEVLASRALLLNNKPHDFPVRTKETAAWIDYHTINLKTVAGAWIKLDMDHHFATFHVSGFYHGQLRGLLGDLNNEPFDDFRLPSGKVSVDAGEFGNAYGVGKQCAPGVAVGHDHHGHHEAQCTTLFAANSPLRSAFSVVEPTPYREACDHYLLETADKKQEYACRVAAAYVTAARVQHVYIDVPAVCAECKSGAKTFSLGETVSVKAPNKASDIVFIVEQTTSNAEIYKELVVPLVASLTNELKGKGITDVDVSLIGFGHPEVKWPTHFSSNGKLTFDGKTKVEFGEAKPLPTTEPKTSVERWDLFEHRLEVELGVSQLRDAGMEALKYPFRVGASKTIVLVTSSNCEKSCVPYGIQKLLLTITQKEMRDRGITMHVVSSLEGFNVAGSKNAKQLKQIVGFDKHAVYSLSDSKKPSLVGSEDLRHDIEYKQDVCVDMSQAVNGAAYSAHNFIEGKPGQRNQFLQVLAKRVAGSLTEELTEDCRCTLSRGVHAQTRCKVTGRKESEPLIAAKGKKGSKN